MRLFIRALFLLSVCLSARVGFSQTLPSASSDKVSGSLLQKFFSDFDLPTASENAEQRLRRAPNDVSALSVRMEAAELQERPEIVLNSALRLCNLSAPPEIHELASNRVLQHAANTLVFNAVLRRVKAAAAISNDCTFNLRLALVAAATDGARLDLDQSTHSAGLVTQWQIVGPFGHFNNVDFESTWPPEEDKFLRPQYPMEQGAATQKTAAKTNAAPHFDPAHAVAPERFWFRDGMIVLPEYFSLSGIFYAAGEVEVTSRARTQIDVLSSGTYEIFVDGKSALVHDARYAAAASRDSSALNLSLGHHRILLKFTTDATPLSVSLHPQFPLAPQADSSLPQIAKQYAQAMLAYFRGDFINMARLLHTESIHEPGYTQYLRALLYSAEEDHSPRSDAAWKALGAAQPSALLARLRSAENAIERGQNDAARPEVMSILVERPQSEMALQLTFSLSRNHQAEAPALLSRLLELHPSCTRLAEAVKFYNSTAEQDKARDIEQQLTTCAPESLQYARLLSESGRHSTAAACLQQLVAKNPYHRAARRFLVEQLALDNQLSAARLQATQLSAMAPNAQSYLGLAADPIAAQDSKSQRAGGFTQGQEFYVPYRRDGIELVRETAQRNFSGGPVVILLADKVIHVAGDARHGGPVSVYVHRITRPLNKEGISRYGEVSVPHGTDLLELRTIKASGEIIEPELAQQKPTISMPALEPGDAIEEEYVMHYTDPEQMPESAGTQTFGSFAAPILYSRLVLLSPPDARIRVREQAGTPQPLVGENSGTVVRIWERNNIAQTIAEPYLPAINLLPTVTVAAMEKSREQLRDELIEATRSGLHTDEAATELHLPANVSEMEKAKRFYRFITGKIDSTGPDWASNPAEDTLANGQGSRTMALLALAHTLGLKAGLVLAHRVDQRCGPEHSSSCDTEPLVRFWPASGEPVDVDAESDDLPFGSIPPSLDTRDALFIPLLPEEEKRPAVISLQGKPATEKSVAEGDLSFHDGDLVADIQVQLGSVRAQEIRAILRGAGEHERQAFFEQLAMRIFPGASGVTGSAVHENDPEQPLRLSLHCTSPQFINRQSGAVEIDQLAPALGLAALYAKTPDRKFPLSIESLYFESTVFHLHLPAGMEVRSLPADFASKSEFGEYTVRFARLPGQVDIHRTFKIPVQVIAPERYAAFANFAGQIDEAERQRISLDVMRDAAGGRPVRVK
jgi:tetratricopeptide (TPR) repeat protein